MGRASFPQKKLYSIPAPLLKPRQTRHPLVLQSAKFFAARTEAMMIPSWSPSAGTRTTSHPLSIFATCGKIRIPHAPSVGYPTVTYNYRGKVFCHDPVAGQIHPISNAGFEEARQTLKKRCPARFAGISCAGHDQCPVTQGLPIPLETDRRVFPSTETVINRNGSMIIGLPWNT